MEKWPFPDREGKPLSDMFGACGTDGHPHVLEEDDPEYYHCIAQLPGEIMVWNVNGTGEESNPLFQDLQTDDFSDKRGRWPATFQRNLTGLWPGNVTVATHNMPDWSITNRIVFFEGMIVTGPSNVCSAAPDGSDHRCHTESAEHFCLSDDPAWSPVCSHKLYMRKNEFESCVFAGWSKHRDGRILWRGRASDS